MTDPHQRHGDGRVDVQTGAREVVRGAARGATADRARVRGRRRDQGAQPVGVRAHALLPPRLAVVSLVVLHPVRARRDLRQADRAVRVTTRSTSTPRSVTGLAKSPTLEGWHIFGTDQLGRDYLSRIIYGIRTSLWVALFVAILATVDRNCRRRARRLLRRPGRQPAHALHRPHPHAAGPRRPADRRRLPRLGRLRGQPRPDHVTISQPMKIGLILALLFWTGLARIVRGLFLSLREKEFVEAAKAAGASDMRIIMRHILPNCVGPIVVNTTLDRRARDPHRGGPLVPRLRHPAAERRARQADRRRPERGLRRSGGSSPSRVS